MIYLFVLNTLFLWNGLHVFVLYICIINKWHLVCCQIQILFDCTVMLNALSENKTKNFQLILKYIKL